MGFELPFNGKVTLPLVNVYKTWKISINNDSSNLNGFNPMEIIHIMELYRRR
jgi:hypothetical protein